VIEEVKRLEGISLFSSTTILPGTAVMPKSSSPIKATQKKWASQASMTLTRDPELLKLAAESGCVTLFIGVESLSSET